MNCTLCKVNIHFQYQWIFNIKKKEREKEKKEKKRKKRKKRKREKKRKKEKKREKERKKPTNIIVNEKKNNYKKRKKLKYKILDPLLLVLSSKNKYLRWASLHVHGNKRPTKTWNISSAHQARKVHQQRPWMWKKNKWDGQVNLQRQTNSKIYWSFHRRTKNPQICLYMHVFSKLWAI